MIERDRTDLMWERDTAVERMPEDPRAAPLVEAGCGWRKCRAKPEFIIFSKAKDFIAPLCRSHTDAWLAMRFATVDGRYGYSLAPEYLAHERARLGLP